MGNQGSVSPIPNKSDTWRKPPLSREISQSITSQSIKSRTPEPRTHRLSREPASLPETHFDIATNLVFEENIIYGVEEFILQEIDYSIGVGHYSSESVTAYSEWPTSELTDGTLFLRYSEDGSESI